MELVMLMRLKNRQENEDPAASCRKTVQVFKYVAQKMSGKKN